MYCRIDQQLHKGLLSHEKFLGGISEDLTQEVSEVKNCNELVVNHLENNREITTKTGLISSLKAYYKDNI